MRQNKNAFKFGWGIRIRYSPARILCRFFLHFSNACFIAFGVENPIFMFADVDQWSHRSISSCNSSQSEGCDCLFLQPHIAGFFLLSSLIVLIKFWCVFDSHTEYFVISPRLNTFRFAFIRQKTIKHIMLLIYLLGKFCLIKW